MENAARKSLYLVALAGSCFATAPVHAQLNFGRMDTGLYLGAGVGGTQAHIDTSGINGSKDESDTGWKVFGGYQFHRNIAVEVGYYDLGKASFGGTVGTTPVGGSFRTTAGAASVVGILPLGDFALFGKLGVAYSEQKTNVTVGAASGSATDRTTNVAYGLGVRYDVTTNIGVRAEWERFRVGGNNGGGKNDIDLYTLNLLYRF
jgi:OOP family OmpA-OmpF porin